MTQDHEKHSVRTSHPLIRRIEAKTVQLLGSDRDGAELARRAHRIMDRFDRIGETMQKVADLQLEVMTRLRPIVDDLGELVKLSLFETRRRLEDARAVDLRGRHPVGMDGDAVGVDDEPNSNDKPDG